MHAGLQRSRSVAVFILRRSRTPACTPCPSRTTPVLYPISPTSTSRRRSPRPSTWRTSLGVQGPVAVAKWSTSRATRVTCPPLQRNVLVCLISPFMVQHQNSVVLFSTGRRMFHSNWAKKTFCLNGILWCLFSCLNVAEVFVCCC